MPMFRLGGNKARVAVLASLLGLAGCGVTVQDTITGTDAEGRRAFLIYAGEKSPVWLQAGNAGIAPPGDASAAVAEAASGAVFALDTTFTADRKSAAHPKYRVLVLFDPTVGISADDVCRSFPGDVPAQRFQDRTNLFMAFCATAEPIAGATVRGPKISSLQDPKLREMVRAGIREMFPLNDGEREPNKPPILGSIRAAPSFGFRLNPLEGIF